MPKRNKLKPKRLSRIGPNHLSNYARKVKERDEAGDTGRVKEVPSPPHPSSAGRPGLTVSTAQAQPHTPKREATGRTQAVVTSKLMGNWFMFLRSSDGETLFLSLSVLRKLRAKLLIGTKVECEVGPAEPDRKYRRVVKVLHIVTQT